MATGGEASVARGQTRCGGGSRNRCLMTAEMTKDSLVRVSAVTRRYEGGGQPAVDRVSLTVAAGEAVAVMGPSGSGKSTLLNLIAGLDRPDEGSITVAGQRIDALNETGVARFRRAQLGMIFQFFNLLDDLTVLDNVLLPAQLAGVRRGQARARADELLATLRIDRHRDAYPGRLSGGERQRVAIARALVNRPALLLADEPTGAVDKATGEEIGELLLDLNASGQTLVLVTHDPSLAARYTHRVVQLADGRIASDTGAADGGGRATDGSRRRCGRERGPGDACRSRRAGPAPGANGGDRLGGADLHRRRRAGGRPAGGLQRAV